MRDAPNRHPDAEKDVSRPSHATQTGNNESRSPLTAEKNARATLASTLCGDHIGYRIEHPWVGAFAKRNDGEWRHDGVGTISMVQHKKNGETKVRCSEGGRDVTFRKGQHVHLLPPTE